MADTFALNRREHDRQSTGLDARVTVGDATTKCTIEDISPGGAQIIASLDLSKGRHLTLNLGAFGDVTATVAWCRRGRTTPSRTTARAASGAQASWRTRPPSSPCLLSQSTK